MNRLGFVTSSPLFDNPAGFNPGATSHEEDIRMRAAAQRAMEAGRPMTMAEMYGKNLQLFRTLNGLGQTTKKKACIVGGGIAGLLTSILVWHKMRAPGSHLHKMIGKKLNDPLHFAAANLVGIIVYATSLKLVCGEDPRPWV